MKYVKFNNRNWSYRGDKGTWVAFSDDGKELIVQYAKSGIVSHPYEEELKEFLDSYNIDLYNDVIKTLNRRLVKKVKPKA